MRGVTSASMVERHSIAQSSKVVTSSTVQRAPRTLTLSPMANSTGGRWARRVPGEHVPLLAGRPCQDGNRCPQVGIGIVKKFQYEGVLLQDLLDDPSLDAVPASVYQPHLTQTSSVRLGDVFLDDRSNIARRERMEVKGSLDGDG